MPQIAVHLQIPAQNARKSSPKPAFWAHEGQKTNTGSLRSREGDKDNKKVAKSRVWAAGQPPGKTTTLKSDRPSESIWDCVFLSIPLA